MLHISSSIGEMITSSIPHTAFELFMHFLQISMTLHLLFLNLQRFFWSQKVLHTLYCWHFSTHHIMGILHTSCSGWICMRCDMERSRHVVTLTFLHISCHAMFYMVMSVDSTTCSYINCQLSKLTETDCGELSMGLSFRPSACQVQEGLVHVALSPLIVQSCFHEENE